MSRAKNTESNDQESNNYLTSLCTNSNFLTSEECAKILQLVENMPHDQGGVGELDKLDSQVRNSQIKQIGFNANTEWLFKKIRIGIMQANEMYKFRLDGVLTNLQFAKYSVGCHYTWHADVGPSSCNRKLSMVIQLSDPSGYSGGDLEFLNNPDIHNSKYRKQGLAVIFPSYLGHRVTPVTTGCRYSIAAWVTGPPFQ